jgi:hypothetical protein
MDSLLNCIKLVCGKWFIAMVIVYEKPESKTILVFH